MRQIKFLLTVLLPLMFVADTSLAQDQKEIDFKKACDGLLLQVSKKKLSGVNSYVNSVYGVYVLYRIGVPDEYKKFSKLDGELPFRFEEYPITAADLKKYALQYGKLPAYECEGGVWKKRGYFADSVKKYRPMSDIAAFHLKYDNIKTGKKDLDAIKFIEQNSRKVIFTSSKAGGIIFYMSYINGKWYLSVIDTVTMDCSA